ncbi:SLC13 family permease [Agrobacterium rubi]|uniref:SLC13 family permease n=1 Tax=Agrobacterium rubi TaxID=28099 RepID=UPI00201B57D6
MLTFSAILIFLAADGLTMPMRIALFVFVVTVTAWTVLELPDAPVAIAGAAALPVLGALEEEALYRSLGNEIIWLMLAAFIVAAVLRHVGLVEQILDRVLGRFKSVAGLFWGLTLLIFATAFLIPSTSARAAMLAPIYISLSSAIDDKRINRALALLFPSIILLSAGASLIGAGAHLVAADMIKRTGGVEFGFIDWLMLAGPFSLLCCLLACAVLLRVFLTAEERTSSVSSRLKNIAPETMTSRHWIVLGITVTMIVLFMTEPLHGVGIAIVAIAASLLLSIKSLSGLSLKAALKDVEWNLMLFLAGTLVIGEALLSTGTAEELAGRIVTLIGKDRSPLMIIAFATLVATLSHLVINSRTARATVLIPAIAIPLSALGANPVMLILVVTLASGFCQTLMISAKPVALFGATNPPAFDQTDLMKLAAWLMLPFMLLIIAFAWLIWPLQGLPN